MANVTDAYINSVSGTDPQNLMEYITRQKIYDGRYWKEECFGLSVADVLEKSVKQLQCIGGLPTKFLALTLKLLQLHPESELVMESFIEQTDFKYVRALGCLYLRMTGQPAAIYQTLEPLYQDRRKLRLWKSTAQEWALIHMDEFVHDLLDSRCHVLGIALPRLPLRRVLQEDGYLDDGPRPTALQQILRTRFQNNPVAYLEYKVKVEKSPAAIAAWKRRMARLGKEYIEEPAAADPNHGLSKKRKTDDDDDDDNNNNNSKQERKKKKERKKEKAYSNLFKKDITKKSKATSDTNSTKPGVIEHSDEHWDAERAKLGLKPLKR